MPNPNKQNQLKRKMKKLTAIVQPIFIVAVLAFAGQVGAEEVNRCPVKIILDTDIGNDVDDVLAISMLHALQTRQACELVAVTVNKPDELAGPFVDALNFFYGWTNIPIACVPPNPREETSKFLPLVNVEDQGRLRYPHRLMLGSDSPVPSLLLRQTLSAAPDGSLVLVQVGYFSVFAALLDTPGDAISPLTGRELIKRKVKFLSIMGGGFKQTPGIDHLREFNVIKDLPAAKKLTAEWPTPIVWSGFEIGIAVTFPSVSIVRDFCYVTHHPASEAYRLYNPPPHERPAWDLTSVLYAVFPDRGYFDLSEPGHVTVEADGFTRFTPQLNGRDRHLIIKEDEIGRVREALVQLASQPPQVICINK